VRKATPINPQSTRFKSDPPKILHFAMIFEKNNGKFFEFSQTRRESFEFCFDSLEAKHSASSRLAFSCSCALRDSKSVKIFSIVVDDFER
jgi:hypothetical protein